MTISKGAAIIDALKARLQTISQAAGYQTTFKGIYDRRYAQINTPTAELPLIEIIKDGEKYQHDGSVYWANIEFILYIVTEKATSDQQMEDMLQDIRRCLFGASSNATGNAGIQLGGVCQGIWLIDSVGDLGMVESNRIYTLRILIRSNRVTYRD